MYKATGVDEMILYHGNQDYNLKPEFNRGSLNNDYGKGFYTTPDIELAKEWSYSNYNFGKNYENNHWLHTFDLKDSNLKIFDLSKIDILYWIAQLYKFRIIDGLSGLQEKRKNDFLELFYKDLTKYDVIIGWRADDSYFRYARDFLNVSITKNELEKAVKLGNLGIQYFIQSKKAFSEDVLVRVAKPILVSEEYLHKYNDRDRAAREEYGKRRKNSVDLDGDTIISVLEKGNIYE